ncbi:MAG: hypothetical protein RIS35_3739 [Pseudomonadota bacterium]|jgi:hypothetical protein
MNPYRRLLGLLPQRPLQVGTVISVSGGVAIIELPGGGRDQARGAATVGQRVFFRDGAIEGAAPNLTFVEISV